MTYRYRQARTIAIASLAIAAISCGMPAPKPTNGEVLNLPQAGEIYLDISPDNFASGGQSVSQEISANFVDAPSNQTCSIQTSGVCKLITCPSAWKGLPRTNAGTITASYGSTHTTLLAEGGTANAAGYQPPAPLDPSAPLLFQSGSMVTVSAPGADVPAFSASTTGPSAISVTSPSSTGLAVNRSQDLTVAWTGSTAGNVIFQIVGSPPANTPSLECSFSGSTTSGTVPSAALGLLQPGSYIANVFARSRDVVQAGSWYVSLDARYWGGISTGGPFKVPVTVQ
jgi:hypothetical protein